MNVRLFALILGIAFLAVGIAAFIPGLVTHPTDSHLAVEGPGHGYLLGLFHVNILHNIIHLLFGVGGVAAYFGGAPASKLYARIVAISYALLAVIGLCPDPRINTLFGLVPIHGHDVWLHALIAAVAACFGWAGARIHHGPTPHVTTHA